MNLKEHSTLKSSRGVVIRKATEKDLGAILDIENFSFSLIDRFPASLFSHYLHKYKDGFFVVLEPSGSVVGYAIIVKSKGNAYLFSIAVHPENRNQGYAELLLNFLESKCVQMGLSKLCLDVRFDNAAALELYTKLGYVKVKKKKNFYGDGIDAFLMEKFVSS
jgi:ribosomal-protein-alanine N-acetyltransferase